ncbi:MAG: hypothetical protein KC492_25345 [Myxococcales bacterium]|nr:hypothetical protein [Myxococcales bacterium]
MTEWRLRWFGLLAAGFTISGCGGDAFVADDGSSGGTAGNGGTSAGNGGSTNGGSAGNAGSSNGGNSGSGTNGGAGNAGNGGNAGNPSGGSGGTAQCPDQRPSGPCDAPGLECRYGDPACCQDLVTCTDGSWVESPCPQVSCPAAPPAHGEDCSCLEGKQCAYDCTAATVATDATCGASGTWVLQSRPCPGPCGNTTCMLGQVCVTKVKEGLVDSQFCTPTTCTGELNCNCAGALCGLGFECTRVENLGLICTGN